MQSVPYKIRQKKGQVHFLKNFISISDFPASHGVTTNEHGDFGFEQGAELERQKNLLLMRMSGCNTFFKIKTENKDRIILVNSTNIVENYNDCDALIYIHDKNRPRFKPVLIGPTGDSPYVLFTDEKKSFIALVHSGRESTILNIAGKTVDVLKKNGIQPYNIIAAVWPGICRDCYTVSQEKFRDKFSHQFLRNNHLDLKSAIWRQIGNVNLSKSIYFFQNMSYPNFSICSYHTRNDVDTNFLFSSWRRDKDTERNAVFMSL